MFIFQYIFLYVYIYTIFYAWLIVAFISTSRSITVLKLARLERWDIQVDADLKELDEPARHGPCHLWAGGFLCRECERSRWNLSLSMICWTDLWSCFVSCFQLSILETFSDNDQYVLVTWKGDFPLWPMVINWIEIPTLEASNGLSHRFLLNLLCLPKCSTPDLQPSIPRPLSYERVVSSCQSLLLWLDEEMIWVTSWCC